MPTKKIFAIIIIVALLAIAIGFVVTDHYTQKAPDGYYNYEIHYADSFESVSHLDVYPTEGRKFAIVDITLKNDSYGPGLKASVVTLVWRLTLDRLTYDVNPAYTEIHPDYYQDITVEKGRTWGYTVVFEVAEQSVGKLDASLGYGYMALNEKPVLRYDANLHLPAASSMAGPVSAMIRPEYLL